MGVRMIDGAALSGVELFSKLEPAEREFLASSMTEREYEENEPVVWIGDHASEFFVIMSGRVEVCVPDEVGRELRVNELGPGEFFGELALFDGGTRTSTVRTLEPCKMIVLSSAAFRACVQVHGSIALHVLEVLGRRQRHLLERLRGVRNVNEIIQQRLTSWQRISSVITEAAASRSFMMIHGGFVCAWILLSIAMGEDSFDPFPYQALGFIASLEAIFLSMFILVTQSTEGRRDRVRNEQDYQVAVKLQFEIMKIQRRLDEVLARDQSPPPPEKSS
jgi:CRP/FNR family cyclic AMP-dependent transcriptional regulator